MIKYIIGKMYFLSEKNNWEKLASVVTQTCLTSTSLFTLISLHIILLNHFIKIWCIIYVDKEKYTKNCWMKYIKKNTSKTRNVWLTIWTQLAVIFSRNFTAAFTYVSVCRAWLKKGRMMVGHIVVFHFVAVFATS